MTKTEKKAQRTESRTRIIFDLADELSDEELRNFERNAAESGKELKDFFLDLTFRLPVQEEEEI